MIWEAGLQMWIWKIQVSSGIGGYSTMPIFSTRQMSALLGQVLPTVPENRSLTLTFEVSNELSEMLILFSRNYQNTSQEIF